MGLLICGSCVLGYVKVKRTPHLGFTPAYIALMSAVYWLLHNKPVVYCKHGLAARLCVMYSLTCIVLVVSLMYYTFTISKAIVMHITLHGGGLQIKSKTGLVPTDQTCFCLVIRNLEFCHNIAHNYCCFGVPSFLFGALFSFIITISRDPYRTGITAHVRPVLSQCQAGVQIIEIYNTQN